MFCPVSPSKRSLSAGMALGTPDTHSEEFQIIYVDTSSSKKEEYESVTLKSMSYT